MSTSMKMYDMEEVKKHNSIEKGVWVAIHGNVYDITEFIKQDLHAPAVNAYFGQDATKAFSSGPGPVPHSDYAKKLLATFKIGELKGAKKKSKI